MKSTCVVSITVSVLLILTGLGLHIAGLDSGLWAAIVVDGAQMSVDVGLFQFCLKMFGVIEQVRICYDMYDLVSINSQLRLGIDAESILSRVQACEAMEILGAINAGFSLLFVSFYLLMPKFGTNRRISVLLSGAAFSLMAAAAAPVGLLVWGAAVYRHVTDYPHSEVLGYSFYLSLAADILFCLGGGLLLFTGIRTWRRDKS